MPLVKVLMRIKLHQFERRILEAARLLMPKIIRTGSFQNNKTTAKESQSTNNKSK